MTFHTNIVRSDPTQNKMGAFKAGLIEMYNNTPPTISRVVSFLHEMLQKVLRLWHGLNPHQPFEASFFATPGHESQGPKWDQSIGGHQKWSSRDSSSSRFIRTSPNSQGMRRVHFGFKKLSSPTNGFLYLRFLATIQCLVWSHVEPINLGWRWWALCKVGGCSV